jgi:hypothetical protein
MSEYKNNVYVLNKFIAKIIVYFKINLKKTNAVMSCLTESIDHEFEAVS